jgi:N-acetylglutamate synthase-like GNAT family acetyltransferase
MMTNFSLWARDKQEFERVFVMLEYTIIRLIDRPESKEKMAKWFHEKWGIPLEAYEESMDKCLQKKNGVPQWYVAVANGKIIGGLGVIENDFHDRKDLTPNVCAVYVEEEYRCHGIAGKLLNFVCADMKEKGTNTLYLVTDHISFYEKYGWKFLCMVQGDGEANMTRMYIYE